MIYLIVVILLLVTIGVIQIYKTNHKTNHKTEDKTEDKTENKTHGSKTEHKTEVYKKPKPFITPKHFGTGYIKNSPQMPADVCREQGVVSPLYTIHPSYVDYGQQKVRICDNIIFNSPP